MGWLGRLYQANFEKQERAVEFNHDRRRLGCNLRYDIQLQLNVEPWEGLGLHILRLIPPLIWPWKEDFWVLMWWRVLRNHDQNNLGTGRNWHLHEDHAKPNVYIAVCFRTWNDQHLVCGTMKLKFNPLSISVLFSCNCMMTKNGQRLLKILKYIYILLFRALKSNMDAEKTKLGWWSPKYLLMLLMSVFRTVFLLADFRLKAKIVQSLCSKFISSVNLWDSLAARDWKML